jgi:hypothetical protein
MEPTNISKQSNLNFSSESSGLFKKNASGFLKKPDTTSENSQLKRFDR